MRTMRAWTLVMVCAFLLVAPLTRPGRAESPQNGKPRLEDAPGYLPMSELGFARQELSVEINLEGALLRLVSEAEREDDPEFSRMVADLRAIRVQVVPLKGEEPAKVEGRIAAAVRWLEEKGWHAVVRVREKNEQSYIYTREIGGEIVGLTVVAIEPDEAALINIVGRLDPAQLGRLGRGLHLRALERARGRKE